MQRNRLACGALFALILVTLLPVPVRGAALGELAGTCLTKARETHRVVGLSAAISLNGEIVWEGGAGYRDLEAQIPANGAMVHRIASISKPMTAVAAMQLQALGKIDLEAPLQKYLPWFPVQAQGTIQIEHLLNHTSGIRHYGPGESRPTTHYDTLKEGITVFMERPLKFEPGTNFQYTTYGYTTLGAVVEAASGQAYGDYMREHVWGPAGMEQTGLEYFGVAVENKAKLYRTKQDTEGFEPDDETDLSIKYPGGGILSTAGDLLRFAHAFENGVLVSAETRKRMLVPPDIRRRGAPYALGWEVWKDESLGQVIFHSGGQSGTTTQLGIYPDQGIAVAILANTAQSSLTPIREELVKIAVAQQAQD